MSDKSIKAYHMSKSNEWGTPKDLYQSLDEEFRFTLDPCATSENHKCHKYFTIADDGLSKSWNGETVFMNPPYGREIGKWVRKAYEEWDAHTTIVCLIPSRTCTSYWHDCIEGFAEVRFIRGRLKFGEAKKNAPFPSAIVIFKKEHLEVLNDN